MILRYSSTSCLPPCRGWLAGRTDVKTPAPCRSDTQVALSPSQVSAAPCTAPQRSPSHSRRRPPKWQSNVRSRLHLLIFRLSISQVSLNLPGGCACLSSSSSLFVNGNSPDLVPLFVLVCAASVTPVRVRRPHSNPQPSFSSVRLVGPGTACRCHSSSLKTKPQRPRPLQTVSLGISPLQPNPRWPRLGPVAFISLALLTHYKLRFPILLRTGDSRRNPPFRIRASDPILSLHRNRDNLSHAPR